MATGITISILQQYFSRLIAKFLNCTSDLLIRHDRGGKIVIFRQWQPGAAWNAKSNDWLDLRVTIVGALLLSSAAELLCSIGARSASCSPAIACLLCAAARLRACCRPAALLRRRACEFHCSHGPADLRDAFFLFWHECMWKGCSPSPSPHTFAGPHFPWTAAFAAQYFTLTLVMFSKLYLLGFFLLNPCFQTSLCVL